MDTRQFSMFGLAALGLALAIPVHAATPFADGAFLVAERERRDDTRYERREPRREERRELRRETEREESHGYGYGYERRHQERNEYDDRSRGRR